MNRILYLLVLLNFSCSAQSRKMYSDEFLDHVEKYGMDLREDSLFFETDTTVIPNYLEIDRKYLFTNSSKEKLILKRINYTDYSYELTSKQLEEKGTVSLKPTFHFGADFAEKDGELVISSLEQNLDGLCLAEIGIGNYNTQLGKVDTYVAIRLNSNCGEFSSNIFVVQR